MQNFTNNYDKELLLINFPITFTETGTEKSFTVHVPTLKELYSHKGIMTVIGLFEKDVKELGKMMPGIEIKSHWSFINLITSLGSQREELKEIMDTILEGLKLIFGEVSVTGGQIKVGNEIFLNSKTFEEVRLIIVEGMGGEKPIVINEEDDEFTRREKEAEIRTRKIKESARKKAQSQSDRTDIQDMLAAIQYEFPQYKLTDLFEMNMFTLSYLFSYTGKIASYEVMKVAAGNGLAKNFKYFIEK